MAASINGRLKNHVTAQGFYVASADGRGFGFNNNRDPERVLQFIQKGLTAYRQSPPSNAQISAEEVSARYSRGADPSVSILSVYSRVYPLPAGCDELNHGVGRDFLWIYPEEVRAMRQGQLPQAFVRRLVRYHLVDNVRGEPDFWNAPQIGKEEFSLSAKAGKLYLVGRFSMASMQPAGEHGLDGTLEAEITLDPQQDRIKDFKGYASSVAWGAGKYTPNPPPGKFPLVFAIVPAKEPWAKVIPPQAAAYGDGDYHRP